MSQKSLAAAVGAPVEREIGGKVFKFSPLDVSDLADVERWHEGRKIARIVEQDAIPKEMRESLIFKVLNPPAANLGEYNAQIANAMGSISGVRFMLLLSLRKYHPDLTEESVGRLVRMEDMDELGSLVDSISGLGGAAEGPPEEAEVEGTTGSKTPPLSTGPNSSPSSLTTVV